MCRLKQHWEYAPIGEAVPHATIFDVMRKAIEWIRLLIRSLSWCVSRHPYEL